MSFPDGAKQQETGDRSRIEMATSAIAEPHRQTATGDERPR
jgi:hypothetical protein